MICAIDAAGLAIASPDAANAPARPVFFRFADLLELCERDCEELRVGVTGEPESLIESRRKSVRFFVLVTEWSDAASELSGADNSAERGMLGTVALVLNVCLGGPKSCLPCDELSCVGDSTTGDMVTLLLSSPAAAPEADVAGVVTARSCLGPSNRGEAELVSLIRSPLRFDLLDLFDLFDRDDGERYSSCCWRCADVATVADRGTVVSALLACSRRSPAELECDNGRAVRSLADMPGLGGVGVVASSSCGDSGLIG